MSTSDGQTRRDRRRTARHTAETETGDGDTGIPPSTYIPTHCLDFPFNQPQEEEEGSHRPAITWPGKDLPSEEKIERGTNLSCSSPRTALQATITPQKNKSTEKKNQIAGQRR